MINVIGLGYIGLPTALMMASHGVEVVGTDYNEKLVSTLNEGKKPLLRKTDSRNSFRMHLKQELSLQRNIR